MPVPILIFAILTFRRCVALFALFLLAPVVLLARNPEPSVRIPLEPLGFQPLSPQFLLAGSSMLTLHYVDDKHLLVTFSTRRLIPRLVDDPPDDQDHIMEVVLLEVPSGHVLGRTSWHLHDHGQYLWDLGHGRFLLRVRDNLSTFAPVANLPSGHPFQERPLLSSDRRIQAVILSPDADFLILETIERPPQLPRTAFASGAPPQSQASPLASGPSNADPAPVQINLFRISIPSDSGDEVGMRSAGVARSRVPGRIPATADGYLAIVDQGRQHWAFDFNSYVGKTKELSPFESSCRPSPMFVSRSEFIAFGCHGGHAFQVMAAFNMRGDEMWEQTFSESYTAPAFAYAPISGRFALSRIIAHSPVDPSMPLIPEMIGAQTVIVYQTDSGKQILRVDSLPVQRAGQNFALSPDGLGLATIRSGAIEIYRLPPLTPKEEAAVREAMASAPQPTDAPARFNARTSNSAPAAESVAEPPAPTPPPTQAAPAPQPDATASSSDGSGSTTTEKAQTEKADSTSNSVPATAPSPSPAKDQANPPEERRKPPTLYNLPSDPARGSAAPPK